MGLVQTANKHYWRYFVFFVYFLYHFYAWTTRFFRRGPVFTLLIITFFDNPYFFKVR